MAVFLVAVAGCRTRTGEGVAEADPEVPVEETIYCDEAAEEVSGDELSDLLLLSEALLLTRRSYVEEHTYRELIYAAIDGMLKSLDPHSSFLAPDPLEKLEEEMGGHFGGVGLSVESATDGVKVLSPMEDSPAAQAGIKTGDTITAVDGKPLKGMALEDAVKTMRGEKGSGVKMTVRRASGEQVEIPVVRDEIRVTSVKGASMLPDEVGYVQIAQFSATVAEDFAKALAFFREKGAKGLVIDLRNNLGGQLDAAVGVAEQLLPSGVEIVSLKGRQQDGKPTRYRAKRKVAREVDLPVAVLVNGKTASAAEILSGALQAHHRGVLVGERTFGKASAQNVVHMALRPDCAVRLTTAYYYTPDGKLIHGKGLEPDVKVPLSPAEQQMVLVRQIRSARGGQGTTDDQKMPDRQLDAALAHLKQQRGAGKDGTGK
ncbi:MAG: S41 family peptidase [Kiritimatiellae bacterium]|nr:S41 family peptidase [Kiritimatiellia bacterium]